ncbi:FLYWCH zinc finger domain-containing protein [Phthorimaea operculella]|nr:FLYWCH zinc finger domain-containing protein [Phthorimaea operculella]
MLMMFNNFTYCKHYGLKNGAYRWRCSHRASKNCCAYLVLRGMDVVHVSDEPHNHLPQRYHRLVLLVKGRNGKYLLMLNGYTYYQHKHLRDGFRWSCTQMGSRSCRGFLHVTKEMLVVRAHTEHTHPPSTYFLESVKRERKDAEENDEKDIPKPKPIPISAKATPKPTNTQLEQLVKTLTDVKKHGPAAKQNNTSQKNSKDAKKTYNTKAKQNGVEKKRKKRKRKQLDEPNGINKKTKIFEEDETESVNRNINGSTHSASNIKINTTDQNGNSSDEDVIEVDVRTQPQNWNKVTENKQIQSLEQNGDEVHVIEDSLYESPKESFDGNLSDDNLLQVRWEYTE